MNLSMAFASSVQRHKAKTALFWGEQEYSFEQLWNQSQVVADRLGHLGVKPGDRVGIWLKNCPEFIPAFFGILDAGTRLDHFLTERKVLGTRSKI